MLGNAVFTAYQTLQAKLGGDDESPDRPPRRWSEAPEPAQVGQRVAEGVFEVDVSPKEHASLLTHITHWVYGTSWGALYGMVQETRHPNPVAHGAALGGVVTATDYTVLPLMHVYEPPWRYPVKKLATDLANHVVYGLAVAGAYRALDRVKE